MHQNGIAIWRLHTKFYKGAWNVSANNSETVGHKGLRQIVYILVFYNISFSWPFPLDDFQFIFFVAWQWKRSINIKYAKEGFIRCKDCGAITANVRFKLRTFQNEKWADKNSLYCSYNKQWTISKWKTWSRGTNSRLPFAANAILNLSNLLLNTKNKMIINFHSFQIAVYFTLFVIV